jgi:hypothetical protein
MSAYTPARTTPRTLATTQVTATPRPLALLFLGQFAIFLVALIVLGRAIDWPASLGESAAVILPLIAAQGDAVALGYSSYFLSALLLVPLALLLGRHLASGERPALAFGAIAGVIAGFCKLLGILRWLTAMPALADTYVDPATSAATREATTVAYDLLNRYAGGVGELLGVMLFSGLWTILAGIAIIRGAASTTPLPRWLGFFGTAAGAGLLIGLIEVFGIDLGAVYLTGSGVIWQLWMVAMGIAFLRLPRATTRA